MNSYVLQNIKSDEFETITKEETKLLFLNGSKEAKEKIFKSNIKLIKHVLNEYLSYTSYIDYDDLFQEAALSLYEAINNYDINYDTEFSTYAVCMIKGGIKKYIRDKSKLIKPSINAFNLKYKINYLKDLYEKKYGKEISVDDIAKILNISPIEISEVLEIDNVISAESKVYNNDSNKRDLLVKDLIRDNDEFTSSVEIKIIVNDLLNNLDEIDKEIIIQYYFGTISQHDLAKTYEINQAQISRKLSRFKNKLLSELDYKQKNQKKKNQKSSVNLTIYDKINFYDKIMIDETIDEVFSENEKQILLYYYPKTKEVGLTSSKAVPYSAKYLMLDKLVFQLAIKAVENNYIKDNKKKNMIALRRVKRLRFRRK